MKKTLPLLGLCALLGACVSPQKVPTVQNTGGTSAFVWHDLISNSADQSESFYTELLGWKFKELDSKYSLIHDRMGRRVGGLVHNISKSETQQSAVWLSAVTVADIDATLAMVTEKGGRILKEASEVPDRGTIAVIADPEGAVLQVVEPTTPLGAKEDSIWIWHELISDDPDAAGAWYAGVFGLETEKSEDGKRILMKKADMMIASVSENPFEDTRSQWIPVLSITGFDEIMKQIEPLGGKVKALPAASGKLALMLDPNNAPVILQEKGAAR